MNSKLKIIFCFLALYQASLFSQEKINLTVEHKTKTIAFGLKEEVPVNKPTVAIALSGGGARGLAQIGVLKALLQAGIKPDIIVGTSMGSIVGGLYAAGYSIDQMDSIAKNTDWSYLLALEEQSDRRDLFVDQKVSEDRAIFTLRLKGLVPILPTALNNGMFIMNFLNLLTLQAPVHVKKDFSSLRTKYIAVCTNLVTGEPVLLEKGSLSQAMRASSSVSFFLSPVEVDSLMLVDGGLVANVPVEIAKENGGNFVIAVNTTSGLHSKDELEYPWFVADQVVSIPMKKLNETQLKKASFAITPDLKGHESADFKNIDSLIMRGYLSTEPLVGEIKKKLELEEVKKNGKKSVWVRNILLDTNLNEVERKYVNDYSLKDSVSTAQILSDMDEIYSSGNYKNVSAEVTQYEKYASIKYDLVPNPLLTQVNTKGNTLVTGERIVKLFTDLIGKPFNAAKIDAKLIQLIQEYREKGYLAAQITNVAFDGNTGSLIINIDEGKLSGLIIEGNEKTNNEVITREFPAENGGFITYNEIEKGLVNLRSTNLFDDITVGIKRIDEKNYLDVKVHEKASSLVRVGMLADNENTIIFDLDLMDENVFGSGSELGLLTAFGPRNLSVALQHRANRVFDTYLTYNISLYYKQNDIYSYIDDPVTSSTRFSRSSNGQYRQSFFGASVSVGTQVEKFGNLIFTGKYEVDEIKNIDEQPISPYKINLAGFGVSTTIDTQDKYPYPDNGIYFKASYETGQTIFGGEVGFQKLGFTYKNYFSIGKHNTLSPRLEMGFGDKTLPLSQEYSLGGQSSFFGMRDYEFRGRQIFLASLEYRYQLPIRIFFTTYFKLRYDLGWTWEFPEQIRFKDFRHGIGATLSFDTPIGPAEFSVGRSFKFIRNIPDNPISWGDVMFYFSIGYNI